MPRKFLQNVAGPLLQTHSFRLGGDAHESPVEIKKYHQSLVAADAPGDTFPLCE
jgi:ribosomal protein S7